MKIGVILAGSGVYDGSEIHESTFALLALDRAGAQAVCVAPDKDQLHVINHMTGEEMPESRNVLIESARIARGDIKSLDDFSIEEVDGLLIPGGFGAAKNLNQWAVKGPEGEIDPDVRRLILEAVSLGKPICGLCMGPTVISQALTQSGFEPELTVGTDAEASPYDISGISEGMSGLGTKVQMKSIKEIHVDNDLKIVSAPCYMMEASISQIYDNIEMAVKALLQLIDP